MAPSTSRAPSHASHTSHASSSGGHTVVIHNPPPPTAEMITGPVLRLRGATREQEVEIHGSGTARRVQWAEGVVNNEGLGRKKSKVCCIYHAPKEFGESSDESSSDSSSDSDSADDGAARPSKKESCGHSHGHGKGKGKADKTGKGSNRSPNAYEKMPKRKEDGGDKSKG